MKTKAILTALILCALPGGRACGPWLPNRLLDNGGKIILDAPEFFFELELKRIAARFHPEHKAVPPPLTDDARNYVAQTTAADLADFEAALASGAIKPADPAKAKAQHLTAREIINTTGAGPLPEEFTSEFADYHRGAVAFKGKRFADARAAWIALLARPAAERRHRSTWAAFMLGKLELEAKNPGAKKWFEQVRSLAKEGFADTPGLAAASLGWQALAEENAGAPDAATALYLEQLATGDLTAVASLANVAGARLPEKNDLAHLAADPVTRQTMSAYILTRVVSPQIYDPSSKEEPGLAEQWLATLEKLGAKDVEDADRLGWTAYTLGRFDAAARWLKRADPESGVALWLKAKLDFRAGKIADATAALARAVAKIPKSEELESRGEKYEEIRPFVAAAGDLGLLRLARSEFIAAFHAFMDGGHWQDAAYIAERVLTVKELTDLVNREFPEPKARPAKPENETAEDDRVRPIRWLLARRLTRLGRFAEARPFFPPDTRDALDRYAAAMKKAEVRKAPPRERAAALWAAAQLAREQGMKLMGAELEPDGFIWGGHFEESDVAAERIAGKFTEHDYSGATEKVRERPIVIAASADERRRAAQSGVKPARRFHYRYTAADLAWSAAKLMPENAEETARVLCTAGGWLKNRDPDAADRFLQAIESRCPRTEIGKATLRRHWFPSEDELPKPPDGQQNERADRR